MNANQINPILAAALEPCRQAIIDRFYNATMARATNLYAKLEACEWNLSIACRVNYNGRNWKLEKEAYDFARSITQPPEGHTGTFQPGREFRRALPVEKIEAFAMKGGEKYAAECLASYSHKLTEKALKFAEGRAIDRVEYKGGENVWAHSFVTVYLADGGQFTIKTQMILNVSKLGTLFNQFPSRLIK